MLRWSREAGRGEQVMVIRWTTPRDPNFCASALPKDQMLLHTLWEEGSRAACYPLSHAAGPRAAESRDQCPLLSNDISSLCIDVFIFITALEITCSNGRPLLRDYAQFHWHYLPLSGKKWMSASLLPLDGWPLFVGNGCNKSSFLLQSWSSQQFVIVIWKITSVISKHWQLIFFSFSFLRLDKQLASASLAFRNSLKKHSMIWFVCTAKRLFLNNLVVVGFDTPASGTNEKSSSMMCQETQGCPLPLHVSWRRWVSWRWWSKGHNAYTFLQLHSMLESSVAMDALLYLV